MLLISILLKAMRDCMFFSQRDIQKMYCVNTKKFQKN